MTKRKLPKGWEAVLQGIKDYRELNLAPVDTIGCERLANSSIPNVFRYQILTSLQLSSQTKDQVTAQAIQNLQQLEGGLCVESILNTSVKDLEQCIQKVGFFRRKAVYMKRTAKILHESYNCDIPESLEEIMKLPGIGPKMAHLTMQCAWHKTVGIGVDTHVHRISNRLGWVKTKNPEETRKDLEDWLPASHWREVNALLVGFGQICCFPVKPSCATCPIKDTCPKVGTKRAKTE